MKFFIPKDIKIIKVPYNPKMKKKEILSIIKIKVGDENFERNLYTYYLGHDNIEIVQFKDLPPKGEIYVPIWSLLRVLSRTEGDLVIYGLLKYKVIIVFENGYVTDYLYTETEEDLVKELYNISKVKRTSAKIFTMVTDFETDSLDSKIQKIDEMILTKETLKEIKKTEIIDRSLSLKESFPQIINAVKWILIASLTAALFALTIMIYNNLENTINLLGKVKSSVAKNGNEISSLKKDVKMVISNQTKNQKDTKKISDIANKNTNIVSNINKKIDNIVTKTLKLENAVNDMPKLVEGQLKVLSKAFPEMTKGLNEELAKKLDNMKKDLSDLTKTSIISSVNASVPGKNQKDTNGTISAASSVLQEMAQIKAEIEKIKLESQLEKLRFQLEEEKIKQAQKLKEVNIDETEPDSEIKNFIEGPSKKSENELLLEALNKLTSSDDSKTTFVSSSDLNRTKKEEDKIKEENVAIVAKGDGFVIVNINDKEKRLPVGRKIKTQGVILLYDGYSVLIKNPNGSTYNIEVD